MKSFLKYTVLATAGMFVASTAAQADSLTVVSWGGAYAKSQIEAYHKPYAKKTGMTINSEDYNGGLAEVKAQVEAGNVTWDLVDLELSDVVLGCQEGLLEELPLDALPPAPDGTAAAKDFLPGTLHECGVTTIIWSTIYAYDKTKFPGAKPSPWASEGARWPLFSAARDSPRRSG